MKKLLALLLIVLIVSAIIYGWVIIRRGFSAREQPSRVEHVLARWMRNLATPADAKERKNPVPLTPEAVRSGMLHWADHCAICHANNGSGNTEIGQNLYPKAPDMRLSETQNLSDGELFHIIQNGIRLTGMPAWGVEGEEEENWQLVHFIRHLPKLTPEEEREMEKHNPRSQAQAEEEKSVEEFLGGKDEQKAKEKR